MTLLPIFCGILIFTGGMSFLGKSLNPVHLLSLVMVIGLAEDYANFLIDYCLQNGQTEAPSSVLLSALTTLLGAGTLSLATHPVLNAIGVTVLWGITGSLLSSLLLIPALFHFKNRRKTLP